MEHTLFLSLLLLFAGSASSQKTNEKALTRKGSTNVHDIISKPATKMVYNYVGRMPQFDEKKNGSLNAYLSNRISFQGTKPQDIPDTKVVVQFLIGESGKVSHPIIVKSAGLRFDSVAVRLVDNMPDWIPARNDAGKVVSVKYTLPFRVCAQ